MLPILVLLLAVASSAQGAFVPLPTLFSPHAAVASVDVIPPGFPLPAGIPHSVLALNEDVLESNATEVRLQLLPDVALTIVWSSDAHSPDARGRIKKLHRRKRNHTATAQLAPSSTVVRSGWVKGYGPGVSMVSFVVAGDSYFGVIHYPELQADGSVVMRTFQVTSIDNTNSLGVAYETFRPTTVEHSDPVIPTGVVALTDPAPAGGDSAPAFPTVPSQATTSTTSGRKLAATTISIDVLFLYTPAAAAKLRGATAILNQINAAVGISNTVYANSGINLRLNLVKVAQVSYTETGFDQSLADLQAGKISGATTLQTQSGADLVQLITTDSEYCGIGYLFAGNAAYGYTVVQTDCLTTGTSTHEIGHNFGCGHDYYSDSSNIYSGWTRCDLGAANNFRTIMSYGCQDGSQSTRVFYHSNPSVSVTRGGGSYPTGNANTATCASLVSKNAPAVAAFRASTGGSGGGGSTTVTCVGGGTCTSPSICGRYGTKDICCPAGYSVWCGGSSCYAAGHECPGGGSGSGTVTCVGGGTCSSPNVCARSGTKDVCCPAASPVWCGGSSCYASGHACSGGLVTCAGGGTCTSPNVCARYSNSDTCCPAGYPVWCGGSSCYAAGKQCPSSGGTQTCVGGGTCTSPNVCARYGSSDTCCSASYPVWCGGSSCYTSGHQCPSTQTCVGGGTCSSPNVCARSGTKDTCCPSSYPVWCGGSSCYTAGTSCGGGRRFALDTTSSATPTNPALAEDGGIPIVLPTFSVAADDAPGNAAVATPVSFPESYAFSTAVTTSQEPDSIASIPVDHLSG